jgi:hypothetical protein
VWNLFGLFFVLSATVAFWIWRNRRRSILDVKGRNKHFAMLARQLHFLQGGDDYFIQLEGLWKELRVLIYPHSFEGPGSITLFYVDTGIPYKERTWIEPSLSLGRAIVEWKRKVPFRHEISGSSLPSQEILAEIEKLKSQYPFIALTLPTRFIFSHYMMLSLSIWKTFVVLLVLDAGRKPSLQELQAALDAGVRLAKITESCFREAPLPELPGND